MDFFLPASLMASSSELGPGSDIEGEELGGFG